MDLEFLERPQAAFEGMTLRARMAHYGVPALSLAVAADGGAPRTAAFGVRDAETGAPLRADDLFQAASISKTVFALVAARLDAQGVLSLDAEVNGFARRYPAADADGVPVRVTLRQILSHTAGFNVHGFAGYDRAAPLPPLTDVVAGRGMSPRVFVERAPGTACVYSGGGTSVGQLAVEDATNRPFAELAQTLVLDPLGMRDSTFAQPLPDARAGRAARAHDEEGRPLEGGYHSYSMLAAAGLWTTAADLTRLGLAMRANLRGEGPLEAGLAERMLTPEPVAGQYGVGFGTVDGWFGHSGGNDGYRCLLRADRAGRLVYAAMTNGDRGGALTTELLAAIRAQAGV